MSYKLSFHHDALEEWRKLDATVSVQFKKKLVERLQNPRVPSAKLAGHENRYKIKLRSVGYRLVYEVRDAVLLVIVVAVGKRERNAVYRVAAKRELLGWLTGRRGQEQVRASTRILSLRPYSFCSPTITPENDQ